MAGMNYAEIRELSAEELGRILLRHPKMGELRKGMWTYWTGEMGGEFVCLGTNGHGQHVSGFRTGEEILNVTSWATSGALLGLLEEVLTPTVLWYEIKNDSGWEIIMWDGQEGERLNSFWGHTLGEAVGQALLDFWGQENDGE